MLMPILPGRIAALRSWRFRLRLRRTMRCDVNMWCRFTLPDLVSFMRFTTPFLVFCFDISRLEKAAQTSR